MTEPVAWSTLDDPRNARFLSSIFASQPDSVSVLDRELTIRLVNPATERDLPHVGQFVGRKCYDVFRARTSACDACPCLAALSTGKPARARAPLFDGEGGVVGTMELFGFPLFDAATGEVTGVIEHARNITREVALEERLQQATRMESLGRLAGGIAHDFNNLLAIILSYATFIGEEIPKESPVHADVEMIRHAGERAADLTRRLLAFSRRDILSFSIFDPNAAIRDAEALLVENAGKAVSLTVDLAEPIGLVRADRARFEQMLVDLVANSRDAMPDGGTVRIETSPVEVGPAATDNLSPGRYVRVSVIDTGCGMSPEVAARAFEPFFTTKAQGQGVGLGLASAFGTALQTGGHLSFRTRPGVGTTFEVQLPAAPEDVRPREAAATAGSRRGRTILVVDDEEGLRKLTARILVRDGFSVVLAASGAEAVGAWEHRAAPFDLLLTDVMMPGMSGRVVASKLRALQPGIKVLYMSGYDDETIQRDGGFEPGALFLQKPFKPAELLARVRECLEQRVSVHGP